MRNRNEPVFMISVVSRLLRVHPQTLRLYEREGFIMPKRTGGQRLYSEDDLERLETVLRLTRELGVNRAGVEVILRMKKRLEFLQDEVEDMLDAMESEKRELFRGRIRRIFEEEE